MKNNTLKREAGAPVDKESGHIIDKRQNNISIAIRKTFLIRIFDAPKASGTRYNPYNKRHTYK
ncbi:hypothetical protein [Tannerella forsythia]|uniref:Uncharacterized protein n=1 Tax=Tannerella forsythia TaxID=28112 RepID=A0A3P1XTZ4_TANFO|nr:hypothetical protein [Tannerella forsythia]RRD61945.1 hypothetical protein EII40_05545 [Tannerella forsythia]RRD73468.1 hypothetical protein EII41_09455 [Tannerella forsythia]